MCNDRTLSARKDRRLAEPGTKSGDRAPELREGELRLVHLGVDLVSDRYVAWMNNPEVVKFTESRFTTHTRESIQDFVRSVEADRAARMWAIIVGETHIGNIKLAPIDLHHLNAELGLIIGSIEHWGKGHASAAISLVVKWAFDVLSLHKVFAGICDGNSGSVRAFEKAGFVAEARQSKHYYVDGGYRDRIVMARFNPRPVSPPGKS